MSRPYRDERQHLWRYDATHMRFAVTQEFFDEAYPAILKDIQRAQQAPQFAQISEDVSAQSPPRLPTYEDVVMMLAHDKWNCQRLYQSIRDWVLRGRVYTFDPLPPLTDGGGR